MALTESTMMELGCGAPAFTLLSTENQQVSLETFSEAEALVVLFICNHCPYVIHIASALAELGREYQKKNIAFVAINSNDAEAYPEDSFDKMKSEKARVGYSFPYLFDASQDVAKAYSAACTPDLYLFDKERRLAYRGQFDDTRPNRIRSGVYESGDSPATGNSLRVVLDNLLSGAEIESKQYPSLGCNIKWKAGNEPEYY